MAYNISKRKISIVGAGAVGSTIAYTLAIYGLADEIVLIDKIREKAVANALDISHGCSFYKKADITGTSDYSACEGSQVVVIAAGGVAFSESNGIKTRTDLGSETIEIMRSVMLELTRYAHNAIYVVVTNPLDVLTLATVKMTGYNPAKIIGSGTVLDTSRLRYGISRYAEVNPGNIHAYILGEHGESAIPVWSSATIGSTSVSKWVDEYGHNTFTDEVKRDIIHDVVYSPYEVVKNKGVTNYAIALSVSRIVGAIFSDAHSVLTVSTYLKDYKGMKDVCLSVPTLIGENGVERIIEIDLDKEETAKFAESGRKVKADYEKIVQS